MTISARAPLAVNSNLKWPNKGRTDYIRNPRVIVKDKLSELLDGAGQRFCAIQYKK